MPMKRLPLLFLLFLILLATSVAIAQDDKPEAKIANVQTQIGGFSYQGRIEDTSGPYDGTCDFRFSLFGSYTGADQIGSTLTRTSATVRDGFFTITQLDFGSTAFTGDTRYLEVEVRCPAGSGSYVTLAPRQVITSAPYAMALPGLYTRQNTTSPNIIGGYNGNAMAGNVVGGTISGGGNANGPQQINDDYGTIGGGGNNTVNSWGATVSGGMTNTVDSPYGTIGGGAYHSLSGGWVNTVGGGYNNTINSDASVIAGGSGNTIQAPYDAVIGGGWQNSTSGSFSVLTGGVTNTIEVTGTYGVIGGGQGNTLSGRAATIPGGENNRATGDYSFAAGKNAHASHPGSFVWSDSRLEQDFESLRDDQFRVRAGGGVEFQDGNGHWVEFLWNDLINTSSGAYLSAGGTWTNASDANLKENFKPVDSREILEKIAHLPAQTWNYKTEGADVRHIGPTAQDFYAAFGLGASSTAISTVDADGVSLAAIQGLYEIVQQQNAAIASLQAENTALEARLSALEREVSSRSLFSTSALWLVSLIFAGVLLAPRRKA